MVNAWNAASEAMKNGGKTGSNTSDVFMKLPNGKHQIRFVGDPKPVLIVWHNKKKYLVPNDPIYKKKVQELLKDPIRSNIAINVIDRADQKSRLAAGQKTRLKILEKGTSVFENILAQYEMTKEHPGGKKGVDWVIIAKVPEDVRNTKYTVIPLTPTPFTDEEREVFSRADQNGKNVKEQYKDLPLGEKGLIDLDLFYDEKKAKEKMDELFAELQGVTKPSKNKEKSDGDDPFGNDDEESDESTALDSAEDQKGNVSDKDELDSLF